MLRNEFVSRTAGVGFTGGLPFAWPEVWVNDEDFDTARECLQNAGLSFLKRSG